jgi:hypothetical protein
MWVFDQCSCGRVGDCFCGGGSYSFFIAFYFINIFIVMETCSYF